MANFGVNIDEVWQQASLVQPPAGPTKRSPYTVPVQQPPPSQYYQQQQPPPQHLRESFTGNNVPPALDIPISDGRVVTQPPTPPLSEIPRLKEQLTQQIDAVTDCQKEVFYLKALVQTLKRELQDADQKRQAQQHEERKKRRARWLWMLFVGVFLVAIVCLLVHLLQKVNQLGTQPLLLGE